MSGVQLNRSRSLEGIVGPENAITDPLRLLPLAIDGTLPQIAVQPANPEEIAEVLRYCAAEKLAAVPVGAATKLAIGSPPSRYDVALLTTRLHRILAYDPGDLTVSVEAGVRVADLNARLGAESQFLPLFVPWFRQSTIAGSVAAGVDSPLRQRFGAARDFLLGAEFIAGDSVASRSGGRVVKNVAGYDLHKLFVGSLGTLAIITRLHFKTFPAFEASRGFLASFSTESAALEMLRRVLASPLTPATLELLDPAVAGLFSRATPPTEPELPLPGPCFPASEWLVAVGFGGNQAVLNRVAGDLASLAADSAATHTHVLADDLRPLVWGRLREAIPMFLAASPHATIARVSVLPSRIADVLAAARRCSENHHLPIAAIARAAGVLYIAFLPVEGEEEPALAALAGAATELAETVSQADGFCSFPWVPTALKPRIPLWGRQRPDWALMRKVKKVFDPEGILSPGRFLGGI